MHVTSGSSARRRAALLVLTGLIAGLLAVLVTPQVASAAVSTPVAGSTVAGVVPITEARGGINAVAGLLGLSEPCSGGQTRIEVHRLNAAGQSVQQVLTKTVKSAAGADPAPATVQWDTVGLPNGEYRIRSVTADRGRSGFIIYTCNADNAAEVVRSDFKVRVDNGAVATATLPPSHISGEPLTLPITTKVAATGALLPNRQVTVTIAGIGSQVVTTGAASTGSVTFAIPHQASGTLTITSVTTADASFSSRTTTQSLLLNARPTKITWTGDLRGAPGGGTARLEGRITDDTPGSTTFGQPIPGLPLTINFGSQSVSGVSNADGRLTAQVTIGGHPRQENASVVFAGNPLWAPTTRNIIFIVGDDAATPSPTRHGLVGGLIGFVGGILTKPSTVLQSTLILVDNLLPGANLIHPLTPIVQLTPLDALLTDLLGGLVEDVVPLGAAVDEVLNSTLEGLAGAPIVGEYLALLPFDWRSVYVRPDGTRELHTFHAVLGVPTPLDLTGDGQPDVVANLSFRLAGGAEGIGGLPILPLIKINRLPNAPADLPISLQALIAGGGLVTLEGAAGQLRFGYDTRLSNAPDEFEAQLGIADGGFDITVLTELGEDITVSGAIEGAGFALPIGDPIDTENPGEGETRFGISFSPAPARARVGLALGDGADIGVHFTTEEPTKIGLEFVQDSLADEMFGLNGTFEDVDGELAMTVSGGEGESTGVAPNIGLQFASDNPLDKIAINARGLAGGDITTELRLLLEDVPTLINFGSGEDGNIGLSSNGTIGVMEAGFSSGGPILTLEEDSYLYMHSEGEYQSVALRLLGLKSLLANLSAELGLDIEMAPGKLRAKVEADGLGVDAAIYESPSNLHLGLAADGAFEIEGSEPIDLITITISDESGALLGAKDVNVRIEDIPKLLSVALAGEEVTFSTTGGPVGLLEMFATSGPEPELADGVDGLALTLSETEFVMAARMHQLREITANVNLGAPSFTIDTLSGAIFVMDLAVEDLEVHGTIDHLVPHMRMEVTSDELGALSGLKYTADEPTDLIEFDVPGFATFSASNPVPTSMEIATAPVLRIAASQEFTLNLSAELEGLGAEIVDLRVRLMEFGGSIGGPVDPDEEPDPDAPIPLYFNTTEVTEACPLGCTYTIPSGTLTLGPVVVGALSADIVFEPAGFAANDATVLLKLEGTSAVHVGQTGLVHCAPGTVLEAQTIITVNLQPALCAESTALGNLQSVSTVAPPYVEVGVPVSHTHTVRNNGPGIVTNVRVDATFTNGFGAPTPTCTAGGVVAIDVDAGTASCAWAGNTAVNATRAMTLAWPPAASVESATVNTTFVGTSSAVGTPAAGAGSTTVFGAVAALEITDVQATPAVVAGDQDIVHRVTAINNGPSIAPNMRIKVTATGAPGAPTISCSPGGTATADTCTWAGDTPAGGEHWAEFLWTVPVGTATGELEASYLARSDAPAADDTASASTSIAAEVANLQLFGVNAPFRVQPGMGIDHNASVLNTGPSAALNVRILADYDTELGVPTVTCSDGGSASTFPEIGRTRCTWLGTTAANGEHSMGVVWTTAEDHPLEVTRSTRFQATSSTAGARDEAFASTTVGIPVLADLEMTGLSAPATWGNGTLVHSATVTNNGPDLAEDLVITATIPSTSVIANPVVTCGPDGVGNIVLTVATCTYSTDTAAAATRTITLTWSAAAADAVVDGTTITVDYLADSPTTGTSATGQTSTVVGPITADLELSATAAPPTWNNGGNLVHTGTVRNNGPAPATGFVISATLPTTIVAPVASCSNSGVATQAAPGGVAKCTYAAAVPATGTNTRTITLTWTAAQAAAAGVGTVVEVSYDADSAVSGTNATGTTSSVIGVNTADLELSATSAPAVWNNGGSLVHTGTVRNNGPASATSGFVISATLPPITTIALPVVTCSNSGVASTVAGVTKCTYAAAVPATGTNTRTITLTWTAAQAQAAGLGTVVTVTYDGDSAVSGVNASGSTTTTIGVTTANLAVTATTAPANAPTGGGLVHTATVTNQGPAATNAMVINATLPTTIAAPVASCSNSGVATQAAPGGVAKCTYPPATSIAAAATRVITLTWSTASVNAAGAGAVVTVGYTADSAVFGADASGSTTSNIVPPQADMTFTGGANPATVTMGATLAQAGTATRTAGSLSPATNMKVVATLDAGFPAPTSFTCSTGGTATSPTADTRQCLWAGDTTGTTARTLTLSWTAAAITSAGVGATADNTFVASSDTPGLTASTDRSATVTPAPALPTADLQVLGITAPESLTIGSGSLVHRFDARNGGPTAVNPFIMEADHDGTLGTPTVVCSSGGTATPSVGGDSLARCQWANTTNAEGQDRTMTVTWAVPPATPAANFDVVYTVSTTSATVNAPSASATGSTALLE